MTRLGDAGRWVVAAYLGAIGLYLAYRTAILVDMEIRPDRYWIDLFEPLLARVQRIGLWAIEAGCFVAAAWGVFRWYRWGRVLALLLNGYYLVAISLALSEVDSVDWFFDPVPLVGTSLTAATFAWLAYQALAENHGHVKASNP